MSSKTRVISRKLISIIIASMVLMSVAIAAVIGVSGYANLESLTRSNMDRSIDIIAKQIKALNKNAEDAIDELNENAEVNEQLLMQSTLGPFYFEEDMSGSEIEMADQIYALQSQLALAGAIKQVNTRHKLTSLALFHSNAFDADSRETTALLHLKGNNLKLSQYRKKSPYSGVISTLNSKDFLQYADLFDISSIYELSLDDFLKKISATIITSPAKLPQEATEITTHRLIEGSNEVLIHSLKLLSVDIPNPRTWDNEPTPAFAIDIIQTLDKNALIKLKELLDVEVMLLIDNKVVATSLNNERQEIVARTDITINEEDYFTSFRKLVFAGDKDSLRELEIAVLSPIDEVRELNRQLFMQVLLVIICFTLMMSILYYFLIARVINDPLSKLMQGIETMAQGELSHMIDLKGKDEMGQLAQAFNEMSADVHEKNLQLKESHSELESLLDRQSKELEATQTQLIESEKMSSLGELVAGVSHEVSTPIGICITAQSFFMDETKSLQEKYVSGSMAKQDFVDYITIALDNSQIINANLSRTAELIKNFKQVAVDQCIEDLRSFNVVKYINDLLTTLKPRIKTLKHEIIVSGDEKLIVTSLPGALAQIITNLIMNSIIHGFDEIEKGHVEIKVIGVEGGILLCYADDGKGMTEEACGKIFDPFFTTRKGKGGTGLGMNIVYKLITDNLQGSIECKTESGKGIQFEIFIADQEI